MPDLSVRAPERQDTDERETPPELYQEIVRRVGRPSLDVCATKQNTKCPTFYTPFDDGLSQPWAVNFWMNPPYSDVQEWASKACREVVNHSVRGIVLVPSATETAWWATLWDFAAEVAFLTPRVRFLKDGKPMGSPPFGSAVFVLEPRLLSGPPRAGLMRWRS